MEVAETVRVEDIERLAGKGILVELKEIAGPLGETAAVSMTVPVNPLRLANVIVADVDEP